MSMNKTPASAPAAPSHQANGPRRVFVRDLEIVASVGVLEREKRYEQRIIVSAELLVRDDYDGVSDRLADVFAVGYGRLWLPPPARSIQEGNCIGSRFRPQKQASTRSVSQTYPG